MAVEKRWIYLLHAAIVTILLVAAITMGSLVVCGFMEENSWCRWWPHITPDRILHLIRSAGIWGAGVSMGIMILHSFIPFPGELVAIANGKIYGPFLGILITWTGAMLGAFLAFGLSRRLGQPFVRRMLSARKAQMVDDWVSTHSTHALFISRFIPIIAFNLINYAAGLTKVSWLTFAWTTGLGILPMTTLMVIMGDRIGTLPWYTWVLMLAGGLLLWMSIHRFFRRSVDKEPPSPESRGTPPGS